MPHRCSKFITTLFPSSPQNYSIGQDSQRSKMCPEDVHMILKLDGVGPVENRSSTNELQQFVSWHLIHDTWQVKNGGRWTFTQNFSSLALPVWVQWCFEGLEEKDDRLSQWMNEWMSNKGDCRTAGNTGSVKYVLKLPKYDPHDEGQRRAVYSVRFIHCTCLNITTRKICLKSVLLVSPISIPESILYSYFSCFLNMYFFKVLYSVCGIRHFLLHP